MEIRYSCNQRDFKRYTTEETRKEFLIENLYAANEVVAVYSHVDRMVTLGCMPTTETVPIDKGIDIWHNFGTQYFLERREIGIFNIGGAVGHHGGPCGPGGVPCQRRFQLRQRPCAVCGRRHPRLHRQAAAVKQSQPFRKRWL